MSDKKENYKFIWVGMEAHKPPVFKEVKNKDYILYGTDPKWKNRYPDYLINLYNTSPKHNAIVNGKVNYIVGQGFNCVGRLTMGQKAMVEAFINSTGKDSLRELNKKVALDLVLFGGYSVQPIMNRAGDKIAEVHHIDFSKLRKLKDDSGWAFTSDWAARNPEKNEDYTIIT